MPPTDHGLAHATLTLAAVPENVAIVRHVVSGLGDALQFDAEKTDDLRLAVSEACTNAVIHAYTGRDDGVMEIEAMVEPPLLHVLVRDRGRGLRPRLDSPGLGMGLPLIASLSESLELTTIDGATEVRMAFVIPSASSADEFEAGRD
jgi:serine/threonine-protein kinase RsbW